MLYFLKVKFPLHKKVTAYSNICVYILNMKKNLLKPKCQPFCLTELIRYGKGDNNSASHMEARKWHNYQSLLTLTCTKISNFTNKDNSFFLIIFAIFTYIFYTLNITIMMWQKYYIWLFLSCNGYYIYIHISYTNWDNYYRTALIPYLFLLLKYIVCLNI